MFLVYDYQHTNTIYVFEKDVSDYFQPQGIDTVHYLILTLNPTRLAKPISDNITKKYSILTI